MTSVPTDFNLKNEKSGREYKVIAIKHAGIDLQQTYYLLINITPGENASPQWYDNLDTLNYQDY